MHLTHYAYCGMSVPLKDGDEEECRASAARILRRRRNGGHPINVLEPGKEWEIEEREDAMMVSDQAGIMKLEEERTIL